MVHILLGLNSYIDMWLNTRLVHDLYLKIMEGHLSMIDCEKLSCKNISVIFYFALINCSKWPRWLGLWMFPRRGFTMSKHWCVDLWSGCVSGYWRCLSSVGIPVLSNMVSDPVWRPAPVVDRDCEAELYHIHFLSFLYISGLRGLFHCIRSTRFIQEHFSFHSKRFLFAQDTAITVRIQRYKVWIRIFFCKVLILFQFVFFFSGLLLF